MSSFEFSAAFFVKLGRGGEWEESSIKNNCLRLGWSMCTLDEINDHNWDAVEKKIQAEKKGKPIGVISSDLNALKRIVNSTGDDIWITFYHNKLWWTRLAPGPIQEDAISKFRVTAQPWSDQNANNRILAINDLPGKLAQVQGFRGTVCSVAEVDLLRRILEGNSSDLATKISVQRRELAETLSKAIQDLHWKDFETLVDLVFRAAGWIRISVLGQHVKAYDLLLKEPITGDLYVVQVKSEASHADLMETIKNFSPSNYKRIFFVVHTPDKKLREGLEIPNHVEIVLPKRLGELAMEAGLAGWIEKKIS